MSEKINIYQKNIVRKLAAKPKSTNITIDKLPVPISQVYHVCCFTEYDGYDILVGAMSPQEARIYGKEYFLYEQGVEGRFSLNIETFKKWVKLYLDDAYQGNQDLEIEALDMFKANNWPTSLGVEGCIYLGSGC